MNGHKKMELRGQVTTTIKKLLDDLVAIPSVIQHMSPNFYLCPSPMLKAHDLGQFSRCPRQLLAYNVELLPMVQWASWNCGKLQEYLTPQKKRKNSLSIWMKVPFKGHWRIEKLVPLRIIFFMAHVFTKKKDYISF